MTTRSIDLKRRWQQPQDAASGKWSAEIGQNTNNNHDVFGGVKYWVRRNIFCKTKLKCQWMHVDAELLNIRYFNQNLQHLIWSFRYADKKDNPKTIKSLLFCMMWVQYFIASLFACIAESGDAKTISYPLIPPNCLHTKKIYAPVDWNSLALLFIGKIFW